MADQVFSFPINKSYSITGLQFVAFQNTNLIDTDSAPSGVALGSGILIQGRLDLSTANAGDIYIGVMDQYGDYASGPKLEKVDSNGNILTIAQQVSNNIGSGLSLTTIPWNPDWDAEIQSEVTVALNAYDAPKKSEMDSAFALLNDLTVGEVTNAVLSALSGYDVPTHTEITIRTLPSGQYSIVVREEIDNNSTLADRISKTPRANSALSDGEAYQKSLNGFVDYISEAFRKTP